jgi:cell division protein FtsX
MDGELAVVARVRTGQIAAVQGQLQSAAHLLALTNEAGWTLHTRSLNPLRAEGLAPVLFAAVAGAMLLLIVVTANVAALMLARGIARQAEFGVMMALGATRRRIVLHLLLESAVIVAAAAGFALTLTGWMLAYVPAVLPLAELPEWIRFEMNGRVLLFTFIAAVLGTLGMGLMPSLQSTTGDLVSCIRTGARTIVGGRATRQRRPAGEPKRSSGP